MLSVWSLLKWRQKVQVCLLLSLAFWLCVHAQAHTHVCVYVYIYVCVYVWCEFLYVSMIVVPRWLQVLFLRPLPPLSFLLRQGFSLAGQWSIAIHLSASPWCWDFKHLPSYLAYLFIYLFKIWILGTELGSTDGVVPLPLVLTTEVQRTSLHKNWCKARETMILHMLHDIYMIYYWDYISSPPVSQMCVYELDDSKRASLHTCIDKTWHGWWKPVMESKAKESCTHGEWVIVSHVTEVVHLCQAPGSDRKF